VLDGFADIAAGQLKEMEAARESGEMRIISRHAHSIKGGAANLCAARLSRAAADLENAAGDGQSDKLPDLLRILGAELESLKGFRKNLPPMSGDAGDQA
jgi:HPt (histidine-containing phosphotransfer) domain-containing protein